MLGFGIISRFIRLIFLLYIFKSPAIRAFILMEVNVSNNLSILMYLQSYEWLAVDADIAIVGIFRPYLFQHSMSY